MEQFKLLKLIILTVLVLTAWCCTENTDAYASGISTADKYPYTIQKYTQNYGKGKRVTGKYEYQLPQLKGKTKAIKKINKALKKGYQASLKDKKNLAGYVNTSNQNSYITYKDAYVFTTVCKATYRKKGYISFSFHHEWYAGGVHNGWTDGMTFYIKTGKKVNVANVISGNAKTVKKKIINEYFKKFPGQNANAYARQELNNTKISNFQFYLENGNVIVDFGPYQPGGGNGETKIVLKGNY